MSRIQNPVPTLQVTIWLRQDEAGLFLSILERRYGRERSCLRRFGSSLRRFRQHRWRFKCQGGLCRLSGCSRRAVRWRVPGAPDAVTGDSIGTRNIRLAAIKSIFRFARLRVSELVDLGLEDVRMPQFDVARDGGISSCRSGRKRPGRLRRSPNIRQLLSTTPEPTCALVAALSYRIRSMLKYVDA